MQLLLVNTTDKIQLITGSAANVDVVATYMDTSTASPPVVQGAAGRQLSNITTATTADIVAVPSSGFQRGVKNIYIRNKHASQATDVTVVYNAGGTQYEMYKCNLAPGESLVHQEGIGFFEPNYVASPTGTITNFATAASAAGFAADTYVAGSPLSLAGMGAPTVGRKYRWRLVISKTAVGIAAPVVTVRVGTAGATTDTARLTFTWAAGTAAIDRGEMEVEALFTFVGAGTSAILRGKANWVTNLAAAGLTTSVKSLQVTSGGFDSTLASQTIGLSYNGGTSAVHTIEYVSGDTAQL
jgi:hypothetical protein